MCFERNFESWPISILWYQFRRLRLVIKKPKNRTELKSSHRVSQVIILQYFYVHGICKDIFGRSIVYRGTMFSTGLSESGLITEAEREAMFISFFKSAY